MVRLYKDSACAGEVVDAGSGEALSPARSLGEGTAEQFAGAGIEVSVVDDSTTTLYAQATDALGNVSPCSAGITYVEDSTPPSIAAEPMPNANENQPLIKGTTNDDATTVEVFTGACGTGTLVASGTALAFTTGLQIPLGVVADNSTAKFFVRAKDAAKNASECASVTYVEDSTAPASPIGTSVTPAGPANKNDPVVQGTAEANATVRIYKNDTTCKSAAKEGTVNDAGVFSVTIAVDDNTTTSFSAETVDRAGNVSPCVQLGLGYIESSATPTVGFSVANQTVSESAGTVTARVSLNTAIDTAITVPFTVSGAAISPADHSLANGTVTIPAWSRSASISFNVVDDAINEASETVVITLGTPVNAAIVAANAHTVTITDNDAVPSVAFSAATQTHPESVGAVTVTATLSAATGLDVSVPYAVAGTASKPADHDLANGSISIPAGQTSASLTINVANDSLNEASETIIITLGTPTNATVGATSVHTVTITDNDAPPTVSFSAANQAVGEAIGQVTVTATLSTASPQVRDHILKRTVQSV